MSKSKRDSALLEELQKDLNDACVALKKTADIPITRFTLSIPSFFDTDPSLLGLCKQLIADLTSIDAWNQYIVQISVHKDTYRTQFVKLLNCLLRFVNIMSNKNNQQLIDMMVLLAEIQRNDEESLKSFRQFANMKLGLKSATFVVKYAKYECLAVSDTNADVPDDVPVHRAIGIIKAGIKAKAEPIKKLQDALDHYNGILEEINRKIMSTSMTEADDFVTAEVAPRRSARKSLSSQAAPLPAAEFDDGEVEFKRPDAKKVRPVRSDASVLAQGCLPFSHCMMWYLLLRRPRPLRSSWSWRIAPSPCPRAPLAGAACPSPPRPREASMMVRLCSRRRLGGRLLLLLPLCLMTERLWSNRPRPAASASQ